jgi:hypothetical protein
MRYNIPFQKNKIKNHNAIRAKIILDKNPDCNNSKCKLYKKIVYISTVQNTVFAFKKTLTINYEKE